MGRRLPPSTAEVAAARRMLGLGDASGRTDVVTAWKTALRSTHPDTVEPRRRADAEERTKAINEAKQTLIEALDRGFPDGLPPAGGAVRTGPGSTGAPTRGRSGNGDSVSAGTRTARSTQTPRTASAVNWGGGGASRVHVPASPRWTPAEGRWLLIGALVVACLLAISVVALTRDPDSGDGSRIETAGTTAPSASGVRPVPTVPGGASPPPREVALGAEPYASDFIVAAHDNPPGHVWWQAYVHPRARLPEVSDIIARLADPSLDESAVELAAGSVTCDLGAGPGTGQSRCKVRLPEELVDDLEFRTDGDAWKLVGYWRGV